jgi:hypothetical protein
MSVRAPRTTVLTRRANSAGTEVVWAGQRGDRLQQVLWAGVQRSEMLSGAPAGAAPPGLEAADLGVALPMGADTGDKFEDARRKYRTNATQYLLIEYESGNLAAQTRFFSLPKVQIQTSWTTFTFRIGSNGLLRWKCDFSFASLVDNWGFGKDEAAMQASLSDWRLIVGRAEAEEQFQYPYKRISFSSYIAQQLAKDYRAVEPAVLKAASGKGSTTETFLQKYPQAVTLLAYGCVNKALRRCGHSIADWVGPPRALPNYDV